MEAYFDDGGDMGFNFPSSLDNHNFCGNLLLDDQVFTNSFLQDLMDSDNPFFHNDFPSPCDYCSSTLEVQSPGVCLLCEHSNESGTTSMETSVEESVLQEFEVLMAQVNVLSDKARIGFRDSFYRLAKDSRSSPLPLGGLLPNQHVPTPRSGFHKVSESGTKAIDRAVANLMFNKTETNMRDFSVMFPLISQKEVNSRATRQTYYFPAGFESEF